SSAVPPGEGLQGLGLEDAAADQRIRQRPKGGERLPLAALAPLAGPQVVLQVAERAGELAVTLAGGRQGGPPGAGRGGDGRRGLTLDACDKLVELLVHVPSCDWRSASHSRSKPRSRSSATAARSSAVRSAGPASPLSNRSSA